jgi:NADH dehydrogenase/putative oxidoreductase
MPTRLTRSSLHSFLARLLEGWSEFFRIAGRPAAAILDLMLRLWIAEIFFVSGVLKVANWQTALYLAAHEYPVSWMDPVTAAYLGVSIELLGAVLLALGLATRISALAMLALTLVAQLNYVAVDQQLFWGLFLGWFVVHGAGALSLDRMLARGLDATPIPFATTWTRVTAHLQRYGVPVFLLLLRAWLAATLLAAAVKLPLDASLFAVASASAFQPALALAAVPLLILGLATRIVALSLTIAGLAAGVMSTTAAGVPWWIAALALLFVQGAGPLAIDALIERTLRRVFPQLAGKPAFALEGLPRVVIIGAGFGGLACANRLRRAPVQVTLIDRHNYHLFQPLLYQVATAGLSPGDIATPVRGLFRDFFNVRVLLGTVTGIDNRERQVLLGAQRVPYDYLVLATGASHSYFGKDEWEPFAPGLKRVEDATEVRRRVLLAFEQAESTDDPRERDELLTFLIVGAGPTGVELAGAIAELARKGMEKDFRRFDPASARVILVQSGPRVLPTFPEALSARAHKALEALGVEVRLNRRVERIDAAGVFVSGERIASRTVLWAAGVVASPAASWLDAAADNAGRIKVQMDLSVAGAPEIFAIGDTALALAWDGKPVPGLAPAAQQGGVYAAEVIRTRVAGARAPAPFVYRHLGSLATIGRKAAVADFGLVRLHGAPAWWLWGLVHVGFLVGMRNRISVMFDWFWAYLTYRSGTRLITGGVATHSAAAVSSTELTIQRPATAA